MMEIIKAIIFGVIQGATEFLPVSSSGHLVFLHELLPMPVASDLAFDVFLHFATLLAVVYFFKKDIAALIYNFFSAPQAQKSRLGWWILIGVVPAGLAGWLFNDYIENVLRSPYLVASMLVIVGIMLIAIERISIKRDTLEALTWKKSFIIGLAQAVALIPGTSRSGITIIAGLWQGLKREEAVKFSFLLSIPLIAGAFIKEIPDLGNPGLLLKDWPVLCSGFLAAFVSGFLAVKYFLKYASRHSLNVFAYYRFILALIIVVYFSLN